VLVLGGDSHNQTPAADEHRNRCIDDRSVGDKRVVPRLEGDGDTDSGEGEVRNDAVPAFPPPRSDHALVHPGHPTAEHGLFGGLGLLASVVFHRPPILLRRSVEHSGGDALGGVKAALGHFPWVALARHRFSVATGGIPRQTEGQPAS